MGGTLEMPREVELVAVSQHDRLRTNQSSTPLDEQTTDGH